MDLVKTIIYTSNTFRIIKRLLGIWWIQRYDHTSYFGIDLGSTYSCIAYQKPYINRTTGQRDTNIVVMDQTNKRMPSSVYFTSDKNNKRKL